MDQKQKLAYVSPIPPPWMKLFSYKPCQPPLIRLKGKVSSAHSLCSRVQMATEEVVLIANYIPNDQCRGMLVNTAYRLLHQHTKRGGETLKVPIAVAKHLSPRCLSIF